MHFYKVLREVKKLVNSNSLYCLVNKKGGGKLIVKEVFKKIKQSHHLNRLVTLSPLTKMARNFHLRNGAFELQVNEKTQNFEYKI